MASPRTWQPDHGINFATSPTHTPATRPTSSWLSWIFGNAASSADSLQSGNIVTRRRASAAPLPDLRSVLSSHQSARSGRSSSASQRSITTTADTETADLTAQLDDLELRTSTKAFNIPQDVLEKCKALPEGHADRYWSFRKYKDLDAQTPTVYYCKTKPETEAVIDKFADESILGFDLEWEMTDRTPTVDNIKRAVSVVQLASESRIGIFQFGMFDGDKPEDFMPDKLRAILASPDVVKAGVNIVGDSRRLRQCFDLDMRGTMELSHMYRQVMFGQSAPSMVNKSMVRLAKQVEDILGLPLEKGSVRTSNWSQRLTLSQTDYAASDAYAGYQLYHALDERRLKMSPVPARPAFQELQLPIPLPGGDVSSDESEGESAGSNDDSGVSDDSSEIKARDLSRNPTADVGTAAAYRKTPRRVRPDKSETVDATVRGVQRPDSDQLSSALAWASDNHSPNTASKSALCAYHIWHVQQHTISETAQLMRQPPLSRSTVAGYVVTSIRLQSLPYENQRLAEVEGLIHHSLTWSLDAIKLRRAMHTEDKPGQV